MDFRNPAHIKIQLLVKGIKINDEAKEGLGNLYQEKIYSYSLTDWCDKKVTLPSDLKLADRVYVGFRLKDDSKWAIAKEDNKKILKFNEEYVSDVDFIPRPAYYDLTTSKGIPLQSIGVSCGNHGLSFFINNYCEYFRKGENCKFCSLVPTQKLFADIVKKKTPEDVKECLYKILEIACPLDFIQLSGGSFYDHDYEAEMYIPYIKTIHVLLEKLGKDRIIPIHLTCMPPHNLCMIDRWKEVGLDTLSFNLECPTKEYFEKYCPGKAQSKGYNGMRRALKYALQRYGHGNVFSMIICGIEPCESFVNGVRELLEEGVIPTINIYHHDPLSCVQMDIGEPDADEIIEIVNCVAELFRKHKAKPGRLGCAHYDIGHEIAKGYFEDAR